MELTTILPFLTALACPIAMGLMMWMMGRNMGSQTMSTGQSEAERLHALHAQRRQLEQEIAETEQILALEAQKEALTHERIAAPEGQPQLVVGVQH